MFFSFLLRIAELPYFRLIDNTDENYRTFDSFINSMWVVIITLTTVGYGDITASTFPGRFISVSIAICGSFLMAIVVMVVT
jgi:hypothetical protein